MTTKEKQLELMETMVNQYELESNKAHNNSHYFKGAADGLRQLAQEMAKVEQAETSAELVTSEEAASNE
ncbi:MAG: hypothetical protein GTO54_00025 [Nitrososphaeria archaeon]|nr:hypothetical protein [Nitrososphaeria archaeon]